MRRPVRLAVLLALALVLAGCGGGGGGSGGGWRVDPALVGSYDLTGFYVDWEPNSPGYIAPGFLYDTDVDSWFGSLWLNDDGKFSLVMGVGLPWDDTVQMAGTWKASALDDQGTQQIRLTLPDGQTYEQIGCTPAPGVLSTWAWGAQFDDRDPTPDYTGWRYLTRDFAYTGPP